MNGFTTRAIHGGRRGNDPHGALRMPVYDTVAFEFATAHDLQLAFEGRKPAHAYSRITNPTVEDLEMRVRALADARGVIAFSSGMAAITNVLMALAGAGTNIVTTRSLFGNTLSLMKNTLGPWGLETRFVNMDDLEELDSRIDNNTRAVYLESITNPRLEVADVEAVARVALGRGVPVVLDGTMTTPCLFRSKDFGVAVEVLSSTKFISGGATAVGGLLIDNGTFDWSTSPALRELATATGPFALLAKLRREVARNLGACMSPHVAYLQSLGLETLALRVDRTCANARWAAEYLSRHNKVRAVHYPGLSESPSRAVANRQFEGRFGGVLTFELASREEGFRFMDALKLVRRATNLNDNKTLVIHPASTIFAEYTAAEREELGVSERAVRLSLGIEDTDDIVGDIEQALEAV